MLRVCPLLDQSSFHCSPEKTPTQNKLQAGLTTEFNVRCRRRREVIAFDLATKLTDGRLSQLGTAVAARAPNVLQNRVRRNGDPVLDIGSKPARLIEVHHRIAGSI